MAGAPHSITNILTSSLGREPGLKGFPEPGVSEWGGGIVCMGEGLTLFPELQARLRSQNITPKEGLAN